MMRVTDNSDHNVMTTTQLTDLHSLNDLTIRELLERCPELIVFPQYLGGYDDGIESQKIFSIRDLTMKTYNIMGFIGSNQTNLTISSRFSSKEVNGDYFLHYMLQKVFALNLFNLDVFSDTEDIWDILLICQLPHYLERALAKGVYKEYVRKDYNDSGVKGSIDLARHVKLNNPFRGTIAYRSREHDVDNRITQLVRHTLEYIKTRQNYSKILNSYSGYRNLSRTIEQLTLRYSRLQRKKVVNSSQKAVNHPLYREYETLRKLCIKILRKDGIKNGVSRDKVAGILFDGAWLWEEYLNTIIGAAGYIHPENKKGINGIYLFNDKTGIRYPDFYHSKNGVVIDAKYKSVLDRDDYHQLISYLHVLNADFGYFVHPSQEDSTEERSLNGAGGKLGTYKFRIPNHSKTYVDFVSQMEHSEQKLTNFLYSYGSSSVI